MAKIPDSLVTMILQVVYPEPPKPTFEGEDLIKLHSNPWFAFIRTVPGIVNLRATTDSTYCRKPGGDHYQHYYVCVAFETITSDGDLIYQSIKIEHDSLKELNVHYGLNGAASKSSALKKRLDLLSEKQFFEAFNIDVKKYVVNGLSDHQLLMIKQTFM